MRRSVGLLLLSLVFLTRVGLNAQEVMIAREARPKYPKAQAVTPVQPKTMEIAKALPVQPTKTAVAQKPATPAHIAVSVPAATAKTSVVSTALAASTTKPAVATTKPAVAPTKSAVAVTTKPAVVVTRPVIASTKSPMVVTKPPATTTKVGSPIVQLPTQSTTVSKASVSKGPTVAVEPVKKTVTEPVAPKTASVPLPSTKPAAPKPPGADKKPEHIMASSSPAENSAAKKPEPTAVALTKPAPKPAAPALKPVALPTMAKMDLPTTSTRRSPASLSQPVSFRGDTAFIRLADGFDFPVGKPDAEGYYKARGFRSRGHLGEDWDGVRGGDTDLGDPIFSIGDGVVVFARDVHMGWGNVVIVRHTYRENGQVRNIDALYGHLQKMLVQKGQGVSRGQQIATMGNAHGLYDAHLHLEIRKNIEIGMSRAAFARDFSNYYDPTQFINAHRHLQTNGGTYRVAMNTFAHDARINFDKARNYSHAHTGGGSSESATALKRALAGRQ